MHRLTNVYEGTTTAIPLDSFAYNNNGTLASRSEGSGASAASYSWDGVGRLIGQSDTIGGTGNNVSWSFSINPASQIASEARTNDSYAYNGLVAVDRAYAVNGLNQYTSVGSGSFSYDGNGNLSSTPDSSQSGGTITYTYDIENRLVKAVASSVTTNLLYDPLGRLVQTDKGTTATTTKFNYDGDALVGEYNSSNAMTARYVHGSNAAADDPLVWYTGTGSTTKRWLHADHLGSIVGVTTNTGASFAKNDYDEYGIPGSANQGRFQYTGQAWIGELGMYYYKARIYSPTLGRFLQTDPIGYRDQTNLYAYVGNDPISANDPSGLYECNTELACEAAKQGIKEIREARDSYREPPIGTRLGSDNAAASALDKVLETLGKKDDGGVEIKTGDLPSGVRGYFNGFNSITLDLSHISQMNSRVGESLGHEVQHYRQKSENLSYLAGEMRPLAIQFIIGHAPGGSLQGVKDGHGYVSNRLLEDYCKAGNACSEAVKSVMQQEGPKPF